MQRFNVIGRLTDNPKLKFLENGKSVAVLPVAINEAGSASTYINFITYEKSAINCGEYLRKGNLVYIEAFLKNDNFIDDEKKKYGYKFYATNIEFLSRN